VARNHLGTEVHLIQGDFLQTYWENHFDLITCVGVLGHIRVSEQEEFFRRVQRALRPGGVFLTVVGNLKGRPWVYLPALAFDLIMRLRNLLWRPKFVMYYLSFVLPEAARVVERSGLHCHILEGNFAAPFSQLKILRAEKPLS
jgi:SAM-dependent methyltransferase